MTPSVVAFEHYSRPELNISEIGFVRNQPGSRRSSYHNVRFGHSFIAIISWPFHSLQIPQISCNPPLDKHIFTRIHCWLSHLHLLYTWTEENGTIFMLTISFSPLIIATHRHRPVLLSWQNRKIFNSVSRLLCPHQQQ